MVGMVIAIKNNVKMFRKRPWGLQIQFFAGQNDFKKKKLKQIRQGSLMKVNFPIVISAEQLKTWVKIS